MSTATATAPTTEVQGNFPDFLTVYLNADIRAQFGRYLSKNPRHPEIRAVYGDDSLTYSVLHRIAEVRSILLAHRLNSDRQNQAARVELQKVVDGLMEERNGSDREDALRAASVLAHVSPILTEHYGFTDPRTPAQVEADAAYISGFKSESEAGEPFYYQAINGYYSTLATDELTRLFQVGSKPADELTVEEVEFLYSHNSQAQERSLPYTGEDTTALDRWKRAVAEFETVKDIPEKYVPFLHPKKTPEAVAETRDRELEAIRNLKGRGYPNPRVKSLARIAAQTLAIRRKNEQLAEAVLAAA